MEQLWLEEVGSTNTYVKNKLDSLAPMTMVLAENQLMGRGQRGNAWEAEPGKNLTFSFYFKPQGIRASAQFFISEAVALGIVDFLASEEIEAMVKWPNDIYVGEKKICGILIENSIMGSEVMSSVVGIGLNVNQKVFISEAPNPVSMSQLKGKNYPLVESAERVGHFIERRLAMADNVEKLHKDYLKKLWRGGGALHPYLDAATGEEFQAVISAVEPTGHLILSVGNDMRRYAFKEVIFR